MSIFNPDQWAKEHFQHADLGDVRRTERLVELSTNMATCRGQLGEREKSHDSTRTQHLQRD